MKLDLDPDSVRTSMALWRDAIDLKIPVRDDFKIHFIERRKSLLEGFVKTSTAWAIILGACKPESDQDAAELESLKADVRSFKAWAETGLKELSAMAHEEVGKDGAG